MDGTELAEQADALVQSFQRDAAGKPVFFIIDHLAYLSTAAYQRNSYEGYFGDWNVSLCSRCSATGDSNDLAAVKHKI
ncbi:MAG: hypothetical protein Ct9H90mP27_3710 [Gammaproteobacteria bacterium]|nr:MAG: hypothetical protein Ct9H90mP27_3710 [Gammaproteobacteria bacterium]